jgi:ribonuclease HII
MTHPNLNEEKLLWKKGIKRVAGLDEAGRGPLAGPVVAAAVLIQNTKYKILNTGLKEVNDSKKMSAKKREEFYDLITENKNISWGVGIVSEKVIDRINIKNAAELAMEKALKALKFKNQSSKSKIKIKNLKVNYLLIDGNSLKNKYLKLIPHKLIIGGDAKVFSVATASILAKVTRNRIMQKYHKKYPQYHFDLHKGYPTKLHHKLLAKYGPCKIHRKSFSLI